MFHTQKADGEGHKVAGYKKKGRSTNIKKYQSKRQKQLPNKVDLRKLLSPVENQGELNSCVANAVAGAYEYLAKSHLKEHGFDVSRLYVYYNARYLEEESEQVDDTGAIIYNAIEGLRQYGACPEEYWPYDERLVNESPEDDAYAEGESFLVEDVLHIESTLESWQSCLADGYPIIFGLELFNSFDKQRRPGLIPMPTKDEVARDEHAGHAMLAVGYSNKEKVFIVRNSWGKNWGDKGYCYIPYDYILNPDWNDGDSWTIRRLDELSLDSYYYEDEDYVTIFDENDSVFSMMSDEAYEEMLDAMGEYPIEMRIGLVLVSAAYWDNDFSDDEYEEIANYLEMLLEDLGSTDLKASKIIKRAVKLCEDEELVWASVALLGKHVPKKLLVKLICHAEEMIGVDELADDEERFIGILETEWNVSEDDYEDM